jgi:CcmD family protein
VSYALAAYGLVIAGVLAYATWLANTRRRLERELAARPLPNRG